MEKRGILTVFILTLTTLLMSGLAYADLPTQGTHENVWGTHLVDWLNISFNTSNGMLDNITDELIVSGDIANNTILLQDLADNSVNSTKIVDGAIGNLDLGAITVINSTHIADGAIGNLDLGAITVINSTHIADGAIGNLDLGAITVINSTHLATAAVGADELALGVVNTSHIADGAIGNLDLGAITVINSTHIADGAIGNLDLGAITVINSTHIADGAIGNLDLGAITVINSTHIADGAIGNLDLGAITVINSTHLATAAVGADELAFGAVNATHLGSLTGAINTTHITDESINGSDILNNSIVLNKMASDSVNATALVGVSKILYGTCDVDVPNVTAQKQVNASCTATSGGVNVSPGDTIILMPQNSFDNLTISGALVAITGQINFTVSGLADGVATIVDPGVTKFGYVAFVNGTG